MPDLKFIKPLVGAAVAAILALSTVSAEEPDYTDDEIEAALDFAYNNALFVMLHEAGHAMVSELQIPVLGREEDAADAFATFMMLNVDTEEVDVALMDAAFGWLIGEELAAEGEEPIAYGAEHSLDGQRAFAIVCLAYGADEDAFLDVVEAIEMEDDTRETCPARWEQTADAWDTFLADYDPEEYDGAEVAVSYDEASEDYEVIKDMLYEAEFLETISDAISSVVALPDPITLRTSECGVENAFWDPNRREATFCYELGFLYAGLYLTEFLDSEE